MSIMIYKGVGFKSCGWISSEVLNIWWSNTMQFMNAKNKYKLISVMVIYYGAILSKYIHIIGYEYKSNITELVFMRMKCQYI